MATILIKNSATTGNTPSNLTQGELAINVKDGKLFYGSGSGNSVKEFTGSGGGAAFPYTGSATITGSLNVNGTTTISSSNAIQLQVGSNLLFVSSSGRVGIRNTTPNSDLEIYGVGSGDGTLRLTRGNNNANYVALSGGTSGAIYNINTSGVQDHIFQTGGTERMRISGSGNIGIGTSTPASTLSVSGRVGISARLRVGATGDPNSTMEVWGDQIFATSAGGIWSTFVQSTERLGIGTSSPSSKVHIKGAGATSATTALRVENTNTSASLVVLDNGFVGINTGSAQYDLDVNGTARSTNFRLADNTLIAAAYTVGGTTLTVLNTGHNNAVGINVTSATGIRAASSLGVSNNNLTGASIYAAGGSQSPNISLGVLSNRALITSAASGMAMHTSSMLQIDSTIQGFLPPRTNLTSNIATPAQGLMTYLTGSTNEGLYYYNSGSQTGWHRVLTNTGSQSITGSLSVTGSVISNTDGLNRLARYGTAISGSTIGTGVTAQTIVFSQLIPANTFVAGDIVRTYFRFRKLLTSANATLNIVINTSAAVAGSTTLATLTGNAVHMQMKRDFYIAQGNATTHLGSGVSANTDEVTNTQGLTVINWAVDQYLIWTVTLATADSGYGLGYTIEQVL